MNPKKQLMDGLFFQNPVTVQLLGMCSTMAITTTIFNGIGMGVSVQAVNTPKEAGVGCGISARFEEAFLPRARRALGTGRYSAFQGFLRQAGNTFAYL